MCFCVVEAALAPQELEVVSCLRSVHVVLVQQRESSTIALYSLLFDFWICAWLLSRKLIARLRDDLKTSVFKRYVQVIQHVVVFGGEASLRGDVHEEDALAILC